MDAAQSSEGRWGERRVWCLEVAEQFPTSWPVEGVEAPAVWPQSCRRATGERCQRSPGKNCGAVNQSSPGGSNFLVVGATQALPGGNRATSVWLTQHDLDMNSFLR